MVELLSLFPSLIVVQLFRRTRSRQQISPLRQALYKIKPSLEALVYISFFLSLISSFQSFEKYESK
jgi:hypothetical protein